MATIRTINSPGVQINEIDKSQNPVALTLGATYVMGFSQKGMPYEPTAIQAMGEFEALYGKPTNEVESFFYYGAKEVINQGGNLLVARLPYTDAPTATIYNLTVNQSLTAFTDAMVGSGYSTEMPSVTGTNLNELSGHTMTFAAVTGQTLGDGFDSLVAGLSSVAANTYQIWPNSYFTLGGAGNREGIFVAVADYMDACVQQRVASLDNSDVVKVVTDISAISSGYTINPPFTGTITRDSVSNMVASYFPTIDTVAGQSELEVSTEFANWIAVTVLKTSVDPNDNAKIIISPVESFAGSLKPGGKDASTGKSNYICDVINTTSQYIKMFGNATTVIADDTFYSVGAVDASMLSTLPQTATVSAGTVDGLVETALAKITNIDEFEIDQIMDAGITSVNQYGMSAGVFTATEATDVSDVSNWKTLASNLAAFCSGQRKDCMVVLDVPKGVSLEGNLKYIRKSKPTNLFTNTIGQKIKLVTGLNNSYAALYSNWNLIGDGFTGMNIWLPPSIKATGVYLRTDRTANIWDAPAGLNRGSLDGVADIAFNPTQKDADQLYTKSINYASLDPVSGIYVQGQKTTQTKPSAFDRVNVRRLFLRLERFVYKNVRFFVNESNNTFLRRRLVATLDPEFARIKTAGGITDYLIRCDETNNPPNVVDRNELRVAILIKPTRTAEYIIVDFINVSSGANFEEILQQVL